MGILNSALSGLLSMVLILSSTVLLTRICDWICNNLLFPDDSKCIINAQKFMMKIWILSSYLAIPSYAKAVQRLIIFVFVLCTTSFISLYSGRNCLTYCVILSCSILMTCFDIFFLKKKQCSLDSSMIILPEKALKGLILQFANEFMHIKHPYVKELYIRQSK